MITLILSQFQAVSANPEEVVNYAAQSSGDFFIGKDDGMTYVTKPLSYRVQPYIFNTTATSAYKTVLAPVYVSSQKSYWILRPSWTDRLIYCRFIYIFRLMYAMHVCMYVYHACTYMSTYLCTSLLSERIYCYG